LLDLHPTEPRYAKLLAQTAIGAGKEELADQYLLKFSELSRARPDDIIEFAGSLNEGGQSRRALALVDSLLTFEPQNGKGWFAKAGFQLEASVQEAGESLKLALDNGFSDQDRLREFLLRADQGGQAMLLELVQKKQVGFTLSDALPKGKKRPGGLTRLPGER
jgi:predicted Zn-dependent protease